MKKNILVAITVLSTINLTAQSWQHLTTGVTGSSMTAQTKFVTAFTIYNNKLIVGGGFSSAGGNIASDIAAWDGTTWSTLNSGFQGGYSSFAGVKALTVYNTELIAAGSFSAANTTTLANIAKWDGTNWQSIASSMPYTSSVKALTVYNSKLIAAGTFTDIGGTPLQNIAQWDGTSWSSLGSGISTPSVIATVETMVVFNGDLYAAGNFTTAGGVQVNNIAKWNGSSWTNVGTGFPLCNSSIWANNVSSLCVYNNELYAGNCTAGVSKWSGSSWVTVGGGMNPGGAGGGFSMVVYDNKLIVGGLFTNMGGYTFFNIAAWDGTTWTYVGGNPLYSNSLNGLDAEVSALAVYNGCLYAGGEFVKGQDVPQVLNLNHVAKYCGTVGIEEYTKNNFAVIYPNPSSGIFTFKGITSLTTVEVYDITGRIIMTNIINALDYKLDLSKHDKGVYIYRIVDKQNRVQQGKLLVTE